MRFDEGCIVVLGETSRNVVEYIKTAFSLAKRIPTYVILHSTTVVVGIRRVKRVVAIAPGSIVVCNAEVLEEVANVANYIELVEPTWIDCGLLIPFATENACTWFKDLGIEFDEEVGVIAKSFTSGSEFEMVGKEVIEGGIVCAKCVEWKEVEGHVVREPRMNPLFLFLKTFNVGGLAKARVVDVEIGSKLKYFVDTLVKIGNSGAVLSVGKGYATLFDPLNEVAKALASVVALAAFTTPLKNARAQAYLSKLVK